ncbi:flavin-containing monooxygenase [Mesorhizobium sp. ORM6]
MVDAVVVGAGFGGIYSLHKLCELGFFVQGFEAGDDVGGTWYWNRYPGARCDVRSLEYSYSFSPDLNEGWEWTERYAAQPEILAYLNYVADRLDVRRHIRFSTVIAEMSFDSPSRLWRVKTSDGAEVLARFCLMSTGPLSKVYIPGIGGFSSFRGRSYHTGSWPHEQVDFKGLNVGVIGTGSSGVQSIPVIAEDASHLYVFQRTPNFTVPARNHRLSEADVRWNKQNYQAVKERARNSFGGMDHAEPYPLALAIDPVRRQEIYEEFWQKGGLEFLNAFADLTADPDVNKTASDFVRSKIRSIVQDPKVAAQLTPTDHPIGAKRLCSGTNYFETFNRSNVTLVDVREDPIVEITAEGIRTESELFQLDAIVFATGYDALTGALSSVNINVDGQQFLADKWRDGPRTYLGLMVAGFPNLFILSGPGSPSILGNVVMVLEQQIGWISELLSHARSSGRDHIEADQQAEDDWVSTVQESAARTLRSQAKSWQMGANIPGKPVVYLPYAGGQAQYAQICKAVAEDGYRGLQFEPGESATVS